MAAILRSLPREFHRVDQDQPRRCPTAGAVEGDRLRWEGEGRDDGSPREPEDEFGLRELDGNLRWPGKSRRR